MKLFFTLILSLSLGIATINAQSNQDPSNLEWEQMSQQMEKMMEQMLGMMGDSPSMMMDTFMIKGFKSPMMPGDEFGMMPLDSLQSGGLFDLFQGQMNQLSAEDWEQITKMMEQFGGQMPLIPNPEDLPEMDSKDPKTGKKKKKRKVYTL